MPHAGSALPEGKRVLVTRDAANAAYQQPGVPADAPIIFCNAPHLGYLCAAHGPTLGPRPNPWPSAEPLALGRTLLGQS